MIATFCLVTFQTARNRIWQRIRRLRDPRYLVGAIAGLAYFWFVVFRHSGRVLRSHPNLPINEITTGALSIAILGALLFAWALPQDSGGLQFSEAEIAFLFSAPLRRRDLLLYKTIRAQPQALISAGIFSVVAWVHVQFVGVWLVFSVLSLYFTAVGLARARLKVAGIGFTARLILVGAVLAGFYAYARSLAGVITIEIHSPKDLLRGAASILALPVPHALLFVPRLFVSAAMPASLPQGLIAWSSLVAMGAVLYFAAAGINFSFEEASIAASQRRAQKVERQRRDLSGQRAVEFRTRALFPLSESGPPEIAIVWKNVIALTRTSIAFAVILVLLYAAFLGMAVWAHESSTDQVIGGMMLMVAALLLFFSPQVFANDFRLDLGRAEVLKSYPLSGERLVAAEIAAPLVVISLFEIAFVATGSILLRIGTPSHAIAQFVATPEFVIAALLFAVPVCAMQLILRNALPLYFPAWAVQSKDEARGIVTAGQKIIVVAANILVLALVLLPAAVVFLPTLWIAHHFFAGSPIGLAVATVPPMAVLVGEVWLGVKALGARFDSFDVWNELEVGV